MLSLLGHALLLNLDFGGQELGFPRFGLPWQDRRIEVPELRVVLVPPRVQASEPATRSVAKPLRSAPIKPPPVRAPVDGPSVSSTQARRLPADATGAKGGQTAEAIPRRDFKPSRADAKARSRVNAPSDAAPAPIPERTVIAVERSDTAALVVPSGPPEPSPAFAATLGASRPVQLEATRVEAMRLEAERQDAALKAARREAAQQAARQEAAQVEAARLAEAERQESLRLRAAKEEAERREATQETTARREVAQEESARQEAAQVEAARLAAARREMMQQEARQEAARVETMQLEVERQEAAQRAAGRLELAQQEAARRKAARAESARHEAERQEAAQRAARQEVAQSEATRQESARVEAIRLEAERQEAAQQAARREVAQQEVARQEAVRVEAARLEAERQEAARLQAAKVEEEHREAVRRAAGRQMDAEAAQRAAASTATRPPDRRPYSLSTARRGRLFGRADSNTELVLYAEAMARKIQFNTPYDVVRELAKYPHIDPMVTMAIRSDGSVESVTIVLSSGLPEIDEAIRRLVQSHEHYQSFPPGLARDFDVIEIRRTWTFDGAIRLY